MKIKIKTALLQGMISKAIKGASCDSNLVMSNLIAINRVDDELRFITTDGANHLVVRCKFTDDTDITYTAIPVDCYKIISRITSAYTTLEVADSVLSITGNGKYKVELDYTNHSQPEDFKYDLPDVGGVEKIVTNTDTIKMIRKVCSASVSVDSAMPCYMGYWVGDCVFATDAQKLACVDVDLFHGEESLISPEMMKLLDVINTETVNIYYLSDSRQIVWETDDCVIVGTEYFGIEDYDIEALKNLISVDYPFECVLPRTELLALLDRVTLFVGAYDNNNIEVTFKSDRLEVKNLKSSAVEEIQYMSEIEGDFEDYTCRLSITMLTEQIKAQASESVTIQFGEDSIKLVDGNITQLLALNN